MINIPALIPIAHRKKYESNNKARNEDYEEPVFIFHVNTYIIFEADINCFYIQDNDNSFIAKKKYIPKEQYGFQMKLKFTKTKLMKLFCPCIDCNDDVIEYAKKSPEYQKCLQGVLDKFPGREYKIKHKVYMVYGD